MKQPIRRPPATRSKRFWFAVALLPLQAVNVGWQVAFPGPDRAIRLVSALGCSAVTLYAIARAGGYHRRWLDRCIAGVYFFCSLVYLVAFLVPYARYGTWSSGGLVLASTGPMLLAVLACYYLWPRVRRLLPARSEGSAAGWAPPP